MGNESKNITTELNPFISSVDSGDVLGIFCYGWHSQESIKEKAIEKFGLDYWLLKTLSSAVAILSKIILS